MRTRRRIPEMVYKNGKPSAVIVDIEEYREMLERLEDAEDLAVLEEMRRKPMEFKRLDDFLKECGSNA